MAAIVEYGSSGEEEVVEDAGSGEDAPLDHSESASVISKLHEKFPLNSAPSVPVKVCVY